MQTCNDDGKTCRWLGTSQKRTLGSRVRKPCVLRDGLPVRAQRIHTCRYKLGVARVKGEWIMTEATGGGGGSRAEVERRLI
jgi:hypothetical protein